MKITAITNIGGQISIITDGGDSAVFYPFGKTIYTTTSPGLFKSSLLEFKKDVKKHNFDENKLRKIWITDK